jgi:hypothetical protein
MSSGTPKLVPLVTTRTRHYVELASCRDDLLVYEWEELDYEAIGFVYLPSIKHHDEVLEPRVFRLPPDVSACCGLWHQTKPNLTCLVQKQRRKSDPCRRKRYSMHHHRYSTCTLSSA